MATTTDTRTAPISARLPHEDVAALRSIAERNHSTVSRLVAACVREGLPALGGRIDTHDRADATATTA